MVATTLMTARELAELPSDDVFYELVDGELFQMSPTGPTHSIVVARLNRALIRHALNRTGLQIWVSEAGFYLERNPDTVLAPDISVLTDAQVNSIPPGSEGFTELAPKIVIEVKSPSDREAHIARKLAKYLAGGVQEVWWVRPRDRQVTVHRPDQAPVIIQFDGTLKGGELLPGFELALSELFDN